MSDHALNLIGTGLVCGALGFIAGVSYVAWCVTRREIR